MLCILNLLGTFHPYIFQGFLLGWTSLQISLHCIYKLIIRDKYIVHVYVVCQECDLPPMKTAVYYSSCTILQQKKYIIFPCLASLILIMVDHQKTTKLYVEDKWKTAPVPFIRKLVSAHTYWTEILVHHICRLIPSTITI